MTAEAKKRGLGRGLDALFKDVRREEEAFEPKIKRADELVRASEALQQQPPRPAPASPRPPES